MIPNHHDWDSRYRAICAGGAIGLAHEYATHHVAIDTALGRVYGRDDWVAALVEEQAGLTNATVVQSGAWLGAAASGRAVVLELDWKVDHTGASPIFGVPAGRSTVLSSALVGFLEKDRVFRAWWFVDHAAAARGLAVDLESRARALAVGAPDKGGIPWEFGEVRTDLGQLAPPPAMPAPPGLSAGCAASCTQLQALWNQRRFDLVARLYAADARVLSGAEQVDGLSSRHPWARIVAACPNAVLFFEQAVTEVLSGEDARVALVWRWVGTHTGEGLGPPCRRRLHARGLSVLHLRRGCIASERIVFDELGLRKAALLRSAGAEVGAR